MDILKRWLKLKKAQRVRNPWALATSLNQGRAQGRGNTGTSKGAYKAGIDRNEWNSPDGMERAAERSAEYHGYGTNKKEGFKYDGVASNKTKNNNEAVSDEEKKGNIPKNSRNIDTRDKKKHQQMQEVGSEDKKQSPTSGPVDTPKEAEQVATDEKESPPDKKQQLNEFVDSISAVKGKDRTEQSNKILASFKRMAEGIKSQKYNENRKGTPAKRSSYHDKVTDALGKFDTAVTDLQTKGKVAPFKAAGKDLANLIAGYDKEYPVKKSESTSRRLLNILKESVTVDNDQLEKDFTSALYQAMKKHKEDFGVPTGNNEILKGVKNKQKPEEVKKIMDLPNFTKVKNAPQVKKGITDSLLAMLAGYKLTPKVNPGEMTPAQQRQWERTLQNQMRRKNIDIDKDVFKQLQNFYKDKSDTYTRKKPAKNGVKVEKILTSPPFQGAEFDPVSHRWKKPGEVAAKTGQVNVGTGGKRRIRGAGTGAAQRSVGGHARGIRREERRGVTARAARQKGTKKTGAQRAARIKAFKKLTRKR
jgi:hypothetical protein